MCYDISYMTKRSERYAQHYKIDDRIVEKARTNHPPVYHVQAFAHPDIPVITNSEPDQINFYQWGLIPFWVKDAVSASNISNRTLNARGEEMFSKPSFRDSARKKRCLVIVDGFYEHHWDGDKSYPYYITNKSGEPISLGGLWATWRLEKEGIERNTVSIVTTAANRMMHYIHNHPKASQKPRMPLIIPREMEEEWLRAPDDPVGLESVREMIKPFDDDSLQAYTVTRLRGKEYPGNIPEIRERYDYEGVENRMFL
jgi:putative SOS response-associated peptidase YedK